MTMFNSLTRCFTHTSEHDNVFSSILTVVSISVTVYAFFVNIIAFIGIWLVYKKTLKRTPKLLLLLFATNLLFVFAVALLSVYHFIEEFLQSWFFPAHLALVLFLVLWSSTNLCLVAIDRYLIVIHGTRYQFWKKYFHALFFAEFVANIGYSVFIYFGFKFMGCKANYINLLGIVAFIAFHLVMSFVANILLARYIRLNMSILGRTNNMQKNVAKTVASMTIVDGTCQALLIIAMLLFICSVTMSTSLRKHGNLVLFSLTILSLFKCGSVPLTYILRNTRVRNMLCCKSFFQSSWV